jgi:hypothetical protein
MGDLVTVWAETVLGFCGSFVPAVPGPTMAISVPTTVATLQARIDCIFSRAKYGKPTLQQLNFDLKAVYLEAQFKRLPQYAQGQVVCYVDAKRQELVKQYILLMTIGLDGRKTLGKWDSLTDAEREHLRGGGRLKSVFLWLDETATCTDEGVICRTYTPTDKVYFEPSA